MAEPRAHQLGNRADESKLAEQGSDFAGMNAATVPEAPSDLDVRITLDDGTIIVNPINPVLRESGLTIREGAEDIVMAMATEDPELDIDHLSQSLEFHGTAITPARQKELSPRGPRERLVFYGWQVNQGAAVAGDRVIIRQDMKDSVYGCRKCRGRAHTEDPCTLCRGSRYESEGIDCRLCRVAKFGTELVYSCGFIPCGYCRPATKGALSNGWRAGIIIPEEAQSMPVTGIIVSLGPATSLYRLGDWVLHSRYAGHHWDTKEGERYSIMRESEVMCLLKDLSNIGVK